MKMIRRIAKISNKIAKDIESAIILPNEDAFKKYIEDHPNYREDTEFIVNGTKRKAPAKQEKNDSQISKEELYSLAFDKGDKRALHALANSLDWQVRERVAKNENTSPEILDKLSKDESERVRSSVLNNPNTSSKTLSRFNTGAAAVAVVMHPNVTPELLDENIVNKNHYVIGLVAQHPLTSQETIKKMVENKKYFIQHWGSIANRKDTTSEMLDYFSKFDDYDCYDLPYAISRNKNSSAKALDNVIKNEPRDERVRSGVATHPNASAKTLRVLADDEKRYIRLLAMKHPNYKEI